MIDREVAMQAVVGSTGVLLAAVIAAGMAHAQVYKWTDERGVVNYSSTPPPAGRSARRVDEDRGRVSTIPTEPGAAAAAKGDRALRERVDRLEQDVASQRQSAAATEAASAESWRRWLEQCRADRRTDCDDPNPAYYDPGYGYVHPPGVVRPPLRPGRPGPGEFRPTPFVKEGAGGVVGPYYRPPPGGIAAGSGPYGIGGGYAPAPPGGVIVAPGPGGVGAQYVPVPESSLPAGRPIQRPRAVPLER
jgi:hypothetical protein